MTKLKEYLIRKSNYYVEPKKLERKLFIAGLVFAVVSIILHYSLIVVVGLILLLWILVAMWVLDLESSLMIAIQKQQEYLEKNNLINALLSYDKFIYDYIYDLLVVPVLIFNIGKVNIILWIMAYFLLNIANAIVSILVSNYFKNKLLH